MPNLLFVVVFDFFLLCFSIAVVLAESSGDDDSQWESSPPYAPLPRLKSPSPEDYILMQEESFKLDPSVRSLRFGL